METIRIHEVKQPDRAPRLPALLQVWEASVRATHHFLSDAEVKQIREYVPQALTGVANLFVAESKTGVPVAFMGTEDGRWKCCSSPRINGGKGLAGSCWNTASGSRASGK